MTGRKNAATWEFGDFQTPCDLAREAMRSFRESAPDFRPATIIEPTCGVGSFLMAAADAWPDASRVLGLDIDERYMSELMAKIAARDDRERFDLRLGNFFATAWDDILAGLGKPFLIVGNPPWVTSSDISRLNGDNLPRKSNFRKYRGIESMTGKSNFDISEWMLSRNLEWISRHGGALAVLCKASVARKLLRHAWKEGLPTTDSRIVRIDAMKHFGAAVDACFLSLEANGQRPSTNCACLDGFGQKVPSGVIGFHSDGTMLSDASDFSELISLFGKDRKYTWRSGVKHDCGKVMELRVVNGQRRNGHGEVVEIEDKYVYPLLKSSDIGNGRVSEARLEVIMTQSGTDHRTDRISDDAPMTWNYLLSHGDELDGRRSSIYRNRPRFSIFGVGDYTFADWKVAISGFYKSLDFRVVGPIGGRPTILDDTVYFLGVDSESEARFVAELLGSEPCRRFLESMIFWTDKRPITAELLKRVDLAKVADAIGRLDDYLAINPGDDSPGDDRNATLFDIHGMPERAPVTCKFP